VRLERLSTHVRLNMFPDGGVARLRVHGDVVPDPRYMTGLTVDLAALENGARVVECSDEFYSSPDNMLFPGLARNQAEGWETARRRDGGNDWAVIRLAAPGVIRLAEIDTAHLKFNAPAQAALSGLDAREDGGWRPLLPRTGLLPDARHRFRLTTPEVTHVRLDIYPDGGVSRLRLLGDLSPDAERTPTARWRRLGGGCAPAGRAAGGPGPYRRRSRGPGVSGGGCLRGRAVSGGLGGVLLQEVVELPVLDAGDEGVPLGLGEVEDRALGLLGVAHDDGPLTEVLVLDGNVLAIDELDDEPVAENRFLLGHWHTFFVPALSRPRLVRAWPATHRNARPRGGGPGRSQRPGSGSMSSRAAEISRRAWISSAVALPRSISIISMVQMPDSARATRRRGSSAGTFSGRPDAASSSSSVIRSPK